jgi:hypothetical protein
MLRKWPHIQLNMTVLFKRFASYISTFFNYNQLKANVYPYLSATLTFYCSIHPD